MKDELLQFINDIWAYIESEVTGVLPDWVPDWLKLDIANYGAAAALDLTHYLTEKYTTQSYYEEIQGLADATGADYKFIRRI